VCISWNNKKYFVSTTQLRDTSPLIKQPNYEPQRVAITQFLALTSASTRRQT
jgi:hypothetical protein